MLTLATMKTLVSDRIQKRDATFQTKIEGWLNHRYDKVLRRYPWPELTKTKTVTAIADSETLTLGKDIGVILQIHDRVNDVVLTSASGPAEGARLFADSQDSSGIPRVYWREEDTINAQPTAASVLAISSSDNGDTTQKVRVWGIVGGETVTEIVTLTGTSAANTSKSYTRVDRVSKDGDTLGTITLTSNSAAVTVATFAPTEVAPRYVKIHLVKRPDVALVYDMSYKVKYNRLVNAEDIPLIPCHEVLIAGAYADALGEQRQFTKKREQEAQFEDLLLTLISEVDQQDQRVQRFIPHIEVDAIDEPS